MNKNLKARNYWYRCVFFSFPPKSLKLLKLSAPHQKAGDAFALRCFVGAVAAAAVAAAAAR